MKCSQLTAITLLTLITVACGSDDSDELLSRVSVSQSMLESVEISGSFERLEVDATRQLQFLAADINGATSDVTDRASWTSSDTAVATVNGGLVTGVGNGTATISAIYGPYASSQVLEFSDASLESIILEIPSADVDECSSVQLAATGIFSDGESVVFSEGDLQWVVAEDGAQFASFDDADVDGLLRTHAAGVVSVTASREGIDSDALEISVLDTLEALAIDNTQTQLTVGIAVDFSATGDFSNDRSNVDITDNAQWDLTVLADTTQFANVDNTLPDKGTVEASSAGGGTLMVTCGGLSSEIAVRAEEAPVIRNVEIIPENNPLIVNESEGTVELNLEVNYQNGTSELVTEQAEWTVIEGTRLILDVNDVGVVTIDGVDEIVIQAEFVVNGVHHRDTITVRSENN